VGLTGSFQAMGEEVLLPPQEWEALLNRLAEEVCQACRTGQHPKALAVAVNLIQLEEGFCPGKCPAVRKLQGLLTGFAADAGRRGQPR